MLGEGGRESDVRGGGRERARVMLGVGVALGRRVVLRLGVRVG